MPRKVLEPANDMVLAVDSPHETDIAGIVMPDNMKQQEMVFGTVIFIGPLVTERTKVKDIVAYGPYAGKTIVVEGVEFRLLREGQIEGFVRTVPDPDSSEENQVL